VKENGASGKRKKRSFIEHTIGNVWRTLIGGGGGNIYVVKLTPLKESANPRKQITSRPRKTKKTYASEKSLIF